MRLFEFAQDAKNYYLVTEYCDGGELLAKILANRFFSERIAARVMFQLLSAVVYCHSQKVVHRDLKPDNLVLEADDIESNIKVIDFGTSKIFKPTETMKGIMGTAYYIAPEVLMGNYTAKCDVWSCGVILYILLSGIPPFSGSDNKEIMQKVTEGCYTFNSILPNYFSIIGPQWDSISADAKRPYRK